MASKKKKKNGIQLILEDIGDFFKERQLIRVVAMAGILIFITYYIMVLLDPSIPFYLGVADWGIDQGITTLMWGIILVIVSIFIITYPFQKRYKTTGLDGLWKILITFPLGLAFYLIFFWQFVAHFPFFDFYHVEPFALGDKITHFLVALIITLVAVKWNPKITTIILLFFVFTTYELLELIFIVEFSGLFEPFWAQIPIIEEVLGSFEEFWQAIVPLAEIEDQLFHELVDVIPDTIANGLGILVGWIFSRRVLEKERLKEKNIHKKAKKKRKK
jgi:hypothetical protein